MKWRGLNRGVPWRVFMVGEVKWSEVKWSEVKWVKSGCTVTGIYDWWSEVRWSAVKWRGLNRGVPWRVFMFGEVKWGEVQWSEEKVLLKTVSYTCRLTTLETRYCSFSKLRCFSYMHFVLICTVVVLYCFVMCVCECGCMSGFCNVCVCEGFVMCGCFW